MNANVLRVLRNTHWLLMYGSFQGHNAASIAESLALLNQMITDIEAAEAAQSSEKAAP